ncbi:MAG: lipoyl(octanoyl) transferase LipB [Dehalococcoidia bacterium]|nr:lipoyl(octanoyl) transferase LipB [Dehalococcoidia bacterium]MDW8119934.1 lipoyl(octanoyl) transferase LipB [Chloroflexota bacterium]
MRLSSPLWVADLGTMPYRPCWTLQHRLLEGRAQGRVGDLLLLVEHPPVITLGRRGTLDDVRVPLEALSIQGVEVIPVDRGGQATFHGPGQLVGYPIIHLRERGLGPVAFVRLLEEALITALQRLGIGATRRPGLTGVWVGEEKVCAIGLRVSRAITMHGFALNVSTDLSWFSAIVPCGMPDAGVTSIVKVLGRPVDMGEVKALVARSLAEHLGAFLEWLPRQQVERLVGTPVPATP